MRRTPATAGWPPRPFKQRQSSGARPSGSNHLGDCKSARPRRGLPACTLLHSARKARNAAHNERCKASGPVHAFHENERCAPCDSQRDQDTMDSRRTKPRTFLRMLLRNAGKGLPGPPQFPGLPLNVYGPWPELHLYFGRIRIQALGPASQSNVTVATGPAPVRLPGVPFF
jgi:hypothetical protein